MSGSAQVGGVATPLERLEYRRQFVLGPRFLDGRPGWTLLEVDRRLRLSAHPDLPVTHLGEGSRSVTLLGYLLDPERPEMGDAGLVSELLPGPGRGARDALARTAGWGGRFALLVRDGDEALLFHDACGLRQVYWAVAGGEAWCASQPGLLARELGLAHDPEAATFMASRGEDDGAVYWMPGDRSMYREVRCLLPNHLLDLAAGAAHRFWPGPSPLPAPVPAAAAVEAAARTLRGLVEGARRRFPLSVPLTAGWDSRLMLALSRDLIHDVTCFTLTYPTAPAGSRDVVVPARLLARLGVPHLVVPYPRQVDEPLKAIFRRNADAVKEAYCGDVQAMRAHVPEGRTCLTGDVAEIVKCFWRLPAGADPAPEALGRLSLVGTHPYALRALGDWLDGAPRGDVPLLDLFCWEQMAGRWQAQIRAEYDLVQESFAPLACRALLAALLAVPEVERRAPDFRFFRALIARLWPEVLAEPINPPERRGARALLGAALRRAGLYGLVRAALGRSG
jgi:hypothetical protein